MAPVAVDAWHMGDGSAGRVVHHPGAASTTRHPPLATVPAMEPTHHDVHVPPRSSARGAGAPRRGRGQVRAIARAAGRTCCRPGCETPAAATLVFSYKEQVARLVDLLEQNEPQAYDLCPAHADRTRPPVGWELSDTRPPPSDGSRRLDDDETVAVLAAALRGETPPTRVSVVEGGRVDDADSASAADADAAADGAGGDHTTAGEDVDEAVAHASVDEDPLRAALEELQRVAMPDDDVTAAAPATPLRREPSAGQQAAEPVEPVDDEPVRAVWDEVVSAREASGTIEDQDDDLTLW